MGIDIYHKLYTGTEACLYFTEYLDKKLKKFKKKFNQNFIIYTIGIDYTHKIRAIAIVHPWDNFNPEVGKSIVIGRIEREQGIKKAHKGYRRVKYSELKEYNNDTLQWEFIGLPDYVEVGEDK